MVQVLYIVLRKISHHSLSKNTQRLLKSMEKCDMLAEVVSVSHVYKLYMHMSYKIDEEMDVQNDRNYRCRDGSIQAS